jgi:uncharacterized repeat protein (TIGR01451 family)
MKALDGARHIKRQLESSAKGGVGHVFPRSQGARVGLMTLFAAFVSLSLAQQAQPAKPVSAVPASNSTGTQSIALPLASIGKSVGWKIDPEDYRLNVPAAAAGRVTSLEVYSPEINRNDYANSRNRTSYYGDELYGKTATLVTTFQLSNSSGTELFKQQFGLSTKHDSVQLLNTALETGFYPMAISSIGNGKNSFQLRASAGVRVEASQFIVNARGQFNQDQLVAFIDLGQSALGKTVELANYDADGPQEMILTLVDPKGNRTALNISPDTKWASNLIKVTSQNVGTWKILARILPTTKQFSNSVAIRFRLDNQPLFARVPGFGLPAGQVIRAATPKGNLVVTSSAISCAQSLVFNSSFTLNGQSYTTPSKLELAPGEYTITPQSVNGSSVQPVKVAVKNAETVNANIAYNVATNLKLEPQIASLEFGESTTFTATASTEFPSAIPASIKLALPNGLSSQEPFQVTGAIASGKPLVLSALVRGDKAVSNANVTANLEPNCGVAATSSVTVATPAQIKLEKSVDKSEVKPGDTANFTIKVSNTGGSSAAGVELTDVLPVGLSGENINARFELKPGESKSFQVPALVTATQSATIINTAQTLFNASQQTASASVNVTVPVVVVVPPTPDPAKLELTKIVDRQNVQTGDTVNFTIMVKNTGGSSATNIKLEDMLPAGLSGDNLNSSFDLPAGESKMFTIPAKVTATVSGTIVNTAVLNWNDVRLAADASVKISIPTPIMTPDPAKLELTKTVNRDAVKTGQAVTYTIMVKNVGGSSATDIKLKDVLPAGLSGNNLDSSFDLKANESKVFRVNAKVTATTEGKIVNTAVVNWNNQRLTAEASVNLVLAPAPAEPAKLELTKTVDRDVVNTGETATFTITVTNTGGSTAEEIRLEDVLPAGLSGQNLFESFFLKAGETKTFSVPTTVTATSNRTITNRTITNRTITNTATVNWNGKKLNANARVKLVIPAKLELSKTVDRENVQPGDKVHFTITVINTGGSSATDVQLIDILPAGLNGDNLNTSFDLKAGASKSFKLPAIVTATSSGKITNTAVVNWNEARIIADATVNVTVPAVVPPPAVVVVVPVPAKLELTKTVDRASVLSGETATFTISVKNSGGSSATGIQLIDILPAGLMGQDLTSSFDLKAGETKTFTVVTKVTSAISDTIINTANLNWNGTTQQASAKLEVSIPAPAKLEINKTVDRKLVKPGEALKFTIVVTNTGGSLASGIKLEDILPVGLNGNNLSETFDLAPNQSRMFTVLATTSNNASGTIINTANLNWSGNKLSSSASVELEKPAFGTLSVNAVALTCGTRTDLNGIAYSVNGMPYTTGSNIQLAPGTYSVIPQQIDGSSSQAVSIIVRANQTSNVSLEYVVVIGLDFDSELNLVAGDTDTITVTAYTDFPYAVPATINAVLPNALQALSATSITGTVSSGNDLELPIKLRALKTTNSEITTSLGKDCVTASSALTISAKPLPNQRRESQVVLLARVTQIPSDARVILSDRIPSNASYIANSSRVLRDPRFDVNTPVNSLGDLIPDPYQVGDRLFWVIPEKIYQAVLRSNPKFNTLNNATQTRNIYGISYKLAHTDILEMPKDRIAVILASPKSRSASDQRTAMLDPNSSIGRELGNAELRVIVGDPSVLNLLSQATPTSQNAGANNGLGGTAVLLRVSAIRATTDPIYQAVIVVEAFDNDGKPANDQFATLAFNVEPRTPDADPDQTGYQVKLVSGIGRVELEWIDGKPGDNNPINTVKVEARISNDNGIITSSQNFKVIDLNALTPDSSNTAVNAGNRPLVASGLVSVQANFDLSNSSFSIGAGLRAFAKGTVFDGGILTVAVNWKADWDQTDGLALSGDLLPPANPYERFPVTGDSSTPSSDVRSSEGIYAKLEFGSSYALYGQFTPGFTGVLSNYGRNFNGLQALIRNDNLQVNGFAALVANANIINKPLLGDGTSLYRLEYSDITTSSERVVVTVYDRNSNTIKLSERVLVRLVDYNIDYISGVIQLRRPLTSTDVNGNPQVLNVEYATNAAGVPRELRFGAQASLQLGAGLSINATALQFRPGSSLNPNAGYLFGIGANFVSGGFQLGLEGAFSGSPSASTGGIGFAAQSSYTSGNFQAQARYQDTTLGYINPTSNTEQQGRSLDARATLGSATDFSLNANILFNQDYLKGSNSSQFGISAVKNFDGFSANAGLVLQLTKPDSLTVTNTALYGTFGAELPLGAIKLGLLERVPFIGGKTDYGDITISLDYAISSSFGVRLADVFTYEPNGVRQQLNFSARGAFANSEILRVLGGNIAQVPGVFGSTNIAASYALDNLSGDAGRARVGLDTTIPLGGNWSAQLGGEANFVPVAGTTASLFTGALYNSRDTQASARVQFSFQPGGIKQVYTLGGIFRSSDNLVISPSIEYDVLPEFVTLTNNSSVRDGGRYSIAAAWRSDRLSILTNNTGRFGIYAPKGDEIEGEVQLGYQSDERLFFRSGIAYKLALGIFTAQASVGATYFVTDTIGIGANAAYLLQPATGISKIAFGLEGSFRVLNGLVFSAGFNFQGFTGIGGFTQPGFYVRLDWKFDERLFGVKP